MTQGTYESVTSGLPAEDHDLVRAERELAAEELEEKGHGRLRWGAVFGGAVSALGVWTLLYALGIALGLSTVALDDPQSLRASGVFTGLWGLIAPLIALFVGGLVASRAASVLTKGAGVLHGIVVWGLTTLVGTWLLVSLVSAAVGGAFTAGRTAMETGSGMMGHAAPGAGGRGYAAGGLGMDMDDAVAPINQRLQAEGKATVSARQVETATREVLRSGLREGRLDRDLLSRSIADSTALGRADAEDLTRRIEQQFQGALGRGGHGVASTMGALQADAQKAADTTGKAFWGVFGSLLLGMLAAIGGAVLGATPRIQEWAAKARIRAYERLPHGRRLVHAEHAR